MKHIFISLGVFIFILFCTSVFLRIYTRHGDAILVPNLKYMSLPRTALVLQREKLSYKVIDSSKYSPNYPKHTVMGQNPKAGKSVKEGRKIYLTINPSNYKHIRIPKIIQTTLRNASSTLIASGFIVGTIIYEDNIGKDMVLRISHNGKEVAPGDLLPRTSEINFICGNGNKPEEIKSK